MCVLNNQWEINHRIKEQISQLLKFTIANMWTMTIFYDKESRKLREYAAFMAQLIHFLMKKKTRQ